MFGGYQLVFTCNNEGNVSGAVPDIVSLYIVTSAQ